MTDANGIFACFLSPQHTCAIVQLQIFAPNFYGNQGIKFLPPGLHLFVYSAPPSAAALAAEGLPSTTSTYSSNPLGEGITIRHGLFRFSKPEEVIVRKYDPAAEQVEGVDAFMSETSEQAESSAGLGGTTSKRLKASSGNSVPTSLASPHTISSVEDTIISPEYLKTLDSRLAPYPFDKQAEWKRLTSLISQETVIQVLGVDSNGDCRCDSLMSSLADEKEGAASTSRRSQWGKERSVNELNEMARADTVTSSDAIDQDEKIDEGTLLEEVSKGKERCMRFASFDLKRSWRDGAMGEEITRNSRDKSWVSLFSHQIA
jgi:A1 cistron-splicing factor AAR2